MNEQVLRAMMQWGQSVGLWSRLYREPTLPRGVPAPQFFFEHCRIYPVDVSVSTSTADPPTFDPLEQASKAVPKKASAVEEKDLERKAVTLGAVAEDDFIERGTQRAAETTTADSMRFAAGRIFRRFAEKKDELRVLKGWDELLAALPNLQAEVRVQRAEHLHRSARP